MTGMPKALMIAAAFVLAAGPATAQSIENELVLITPVAKTLTDPALAEFAKLAKEKWNVTLRASALAAGTPVAYGQIVEWKGRPQADIFWGGESALFDKLAEQGLLAKLDMPKAVMDAIPATIGKPKPIYLKDPKGYWSGTVLEPYGIVYQPKLFARLGLGDDIEVASARQQQLRPGERLQVSGEAAGGPADAFGDGAHLAIGGGEEREDAVRLAKVGAAEGDGLG